MAVQGEDGRDAKALISVREQLDALLQEDMGEAISVAAGARERKAAMTASANASDEKRVVRRRKKMAANASRKDRFEDLLQQQLANIADRLEELSRRLDEERACLPQNPEDVPGYAELKTALHNLIEHLELAEGRTAEALAALRERLGEVSRRTEEALRLAETGNAPQAAVQSLEERINALHQRLEDIAAAVESSTRAYVDSRMGELSETVGRQMEEMARAAVPENVKQMVEHSAGERVRAAEERISAMVARLQGKLENLAAGALDVEQLRTDIGQLGGQIDAMHAQLQNKAGRDEIEQVRAALDQLSATVEDKADKSDVLVLKERLDGLAAQLEAVHAAGAPADDARIAAIEEQVMNLRNMMEQALGESMHLIDQKLAAHDAALAGMNAQTQRLQQMEAVIEQLQQALAEKDSPRAAGADMEEVAALREGLKELEHFARDADRNAREMLEATQQTLAEIVERLIALEEGGVRQPAAGRPASGNAPEAASRRPSAQQLADVADASGAAELLGESVQPEAMQAEQMPAQVAMSASPAPLAQGVDEEARDIVNRISQRLDGHEHEPEAPSSSGQATFREEVHAAAERMQAWAETAPQRPLHLEEDFIAAARRAALSAARREQAGRKQRTRGGGLLSRLLGSGKDEEARERPEEEKDDSGNDLAGLLGEAAPVTGDDLAADIGMTVSAAPDAVLRQERGRKRGSLMDMLSGLRGRGAGEPSAQAMASHAGEADAGQACRRLLLAGVVALAAVSLYLSQRQLAPSAPTKPVAGLKATEDDLRGKEGAAAGAKGVTDPAPAERAKQAKQAPAGAGLQGGEKDEGATDRQKKAGKPDTQAGLSGPSTIPAPRGQMSPPAKMADRIGQPIGTQAASITTASVSALSDTAKATADTRAVEDDLPESIGSPALRQAALKGDGKAAFVVATRFLRGHDGVAKDPARGARWLERAAEKGVVVAMFRLGAMHEQGLGVVRDYQQARAWYERAAMAGNVRAMHNLGALYASGRLGRPDFHQAAYWFRKAAEHGLRDSQFNLAVLYHRGQGVPRDLEEAWLWYAAAAGQGDAMAAVQARKLGEYLGEKRLAALKERLRSYRPKPVVRNANVVVIDRPEWRDATATHKASLSSQERKKQKEPREPEGRVLVMEVQRLLKKIGYDVGPVDGILGNRTANAIRLFQLQSRMEVNGKPSPELLERLRQATATHG